ACRSRRRGPGRQASGRGPGLPAAQRPSPGRVRRGKKGQPLCGPLVLAVERAEIELLRPLCLMRVLGTGVDAQVLHLATAERAARDHALDGLLDDALRKAALEDLASGALLDAARVTGVPVVLLVGVLTAGQDDLVGVDDDDVVTVVDVRREGSFVLAAETVGDDGCQTAEDNTLSVDQHPLLHH